jgi:hypothetical protein
MLKNGRISKNLFFLYKQGLMDMIPRKKHSISTRLFSAIFFTKRHTYMCVFNQ